MKMQLQEGQKLVSPGSSAGRSIGQVGSPPQSVLPSRHRLLGTLSALKRPAESLAVQSGCQGRSWVNNARAMSGERQAMLRHGKVFRSGSGTQSHSQAALHSPGALMDNLCRTREETWVPTYFFPVSPHGYPLRFSPT